LDGLGILKLADKFPGGI